MCGARIADRATARKPSRLSKNTCCILIREGGLEPPFSDPESAVLAAGRLPSIIVNERAHGARGGPGGHRTHALPGKNRVLSRLSYGSGGATGKEKPPRQEPGRSSRTRESRTALGERLEEAERTADQRRTFVSGMDARSCETGPLGSQALAMALLLHAGCCIPIHRSFRSRSAGRCSRKDVWMRLHRVSVKPGSRVRPAQPDWPPDIASGVPTEGRGRIPAKALRFVPNADAILSMGIRH